MDRERSDGGREPEVEDEFACAGMLRGSLASLHGTVERIFRVSFSIGADDMPCGNNGQIWLKLRGPCNNVKAAKVGSPGFLLISGLAEPVVQACSLITTLVENYEGTQVRRAETGDRGSGESLDSRRTFKALVEKWNDRHILDLLVLPASVKEILLDLVKDSGLGSSPNLELEEKGKPHDHLEDSWERPSANTYSLPEASNTTSLGEGISGGSQTNTAAKDSFQSFSISACAQGRAEGAEERFMHSPQEVGEEEQPGQRQTLGARDKDGLRSEKETTLLKGNKDFQLLLKFFTAMGYTEEVVKRVLAQTGLKEASQILDLVQQEQDRSDQKRTIQGGVVLKQSAKNRPCETEHREDKETAESGGKVMTSNGDICEEGWDVIESPRYYEPEGSGETKEEGHEEDFVLGVMKRAAASCGYTEQKVAEVYNMLPDPSTHQLLLELQREQSKETGAFREGPREMDDVVLEKHGPKAENDKKRESDDRNWVDVLKMTASFAEPDLFTQININKQLLPSQYTSQKNQHQPSKSQTLHQLVQPQVKGPPMPMYLSSLDPAFSNSQSNKQYGQSIYRTDELKPTHPTQDNTLKPKPHGVADTSPTRARERKGFGSSSSVVVTGEQRFLEGLQTPFDLQLTDKPGDPKLRTIIIDGSNVAMSHGLGHFFSCRGIALAVQHFWDRGHRHISALLPQWRQKSGHKIREQHYLTELQKLGLVSYTPSREFQGKRISSYDDRFMLQLAQKTDGVIVTNDNLRDLSDESHVWRDIIKKRTPDPGNHSFAGLSTNFPDSKPPRAQTEVLNFRDRTLGGALDATGGGKGRGNWKVQDIAHQDRQHEAGGLIANRTPEETASLREQLCQVFPGQDNMVMLVLQCHPSQTDINVLSDLMLEKQED
ncbi:Protein KHNYN KH and NYN domain-containing protein [Channa argus]|uniref:Protein KHNYN KH and NYN domain-containing protein n=1 Tax=Channa argus TaxID=215402 RepID=A0A6G1Q5L2_CHAAH|nr:Protein KHNYN KH and NYN domain-containing protein [Channa argus]